MRRPFLKRSGSKSWHRKDISRMMLPLPWWAKKKGWTGQGSHQKRHPAEVFPSQLQPETDGGHYRKARNEMQELVRAQKNVERFFAEEKPAQENEQVR